MDYRYLAQNVHAAQNQVRRNPQSFIPKLEAMLRLFDGNVFKKPGKIPLRTQEGPNAVQECIAFLRTQPPVEELILNDGMSRACQDHANDIGPKGSVSHSGSDGSSFSKRMERYGDWMGTVGESIDFGGDTGEEVMISLLVDDGCPDRGHRKNALNPKFKVVGIACAPHKSYDHCCVIDYASEFGPKGQKGQGGYTSQYTVPTSNYQPTNYNTYSSPNEYRPTYQSNPPGPGGLPDVTSQSTYVPRGQSTTQTPNYYAPSYNDQTNYAPPQNNYAPPQSNYAPPQSNYAPQSNYTPQSNYAPQSQYNSQIPSQNQYPSQNTYSSPSSNYTPSYGSTYGAPNQTTQTSTSKGPYGETVQTTTTTTKKVGDPSVLNDPYITEQLNRMKLGSGSGPNLRELAEKEAPPGCTGWSINSNTEITNGSKVQRVNITYKFPDGRTKELIKEFYDS